MKSQIIKKPSKIIVGLALFMTLALVTVTIAAARYDLTKQNPVQQVSMSGVNVSLISLSTQSARTEASMCIDLPDNRDWFPYASHLEVGGKPVAVDMIELVNAKDPGTYQGTYRCYKFGFPVAISRADGQVKIVVENIQTSMPESLTEEMCSAAQTELQVENPDFAFSCNIGSQGVGFSISSKPADMTDEQASQLIVGALTDVVEGPWVLTYSVP